MKERDLIKNLHESVGKGLQRESHYRIEIECLDRALYQLIHAVQVIEAAHMKLVGDDDIEEDRRQLKMEMATRTQDFWNWRAWGFEWRQFKSSFPDLIKEAEEFNRSLSFSPASRLVFEEEQVEKLKNEISQERKKAGYE